LEAAGEAGAAGVVAAGVGAAAVVEEEAPAAVVVAAGVGVGEAVEEEEAAAAACSSSYGTAGRARAAAMRPGGYL
jgi:hypothetical protein